MDITRQRAVLELSFQCFARTLPISPLSLKSKEHILCFFMCGLKGKRSLRQRKRFVCVARSKALFHDTTHANKPSTILREKPLISLLGLAFVSRHFRSLRCQKIGKIRSVEILVCPRCLGHRQTPFTRGKRQHSIRQSLKALALSVAIKIPRNCSFIPIEKTECRQQKAHQLEEKPNRNDKQNQGDHSLQWRKAIFLPRYSNTDTALQGKQFKCAKTGPRNKGKKQKNLYQ